MIELHRYFCGKSICNTISDLAPLLDWRVLVTYILNSKFSQRLVGKNAQRHHIPKPYENKVLIQVRDNWCTFNAVMKVILESAMIMALLIAIAQCEKLDMFFKDLIRDFDFKLPTIILGEDDDLTDLCHGDMVLCMQPKEDHEVTDIAGKLENLKSNFQFLYGCCRGLT